jgi:A/G-specific adenine glycosylase
MGSESVMTSELLSGPSAARRTERATAAVPLATLRRRLLAWYDANGRDLPWRRTRDPYPVWLSEVMLQQTRVAVARPYYDAFLVRFPSLSSLARARESQVLERWSGLGYYRRARHLLEAARIVMRDHHGRVPDDPEAFARLPGVGRYTTAAVLSICFGRRLAVLDGNVARVLARLFAVPAAIREPRGAKRLWALAESLVPAARPGDWNQAVMELGATICTPRAPRCDRCPLARGCRARRLGRVESYPPVPVRRAAIPIRRAVAWIERRGRVLLARREGALLAGLWEPPGVEVNGEGQIGRALRAALARWGVHAVLAPTGRVVKHTITHRAIEAEVWRGAPRSARTGPGLRWVDPARPGVPLTALARRLLKSAVPAADSSGS